MQSESRRAILSEWLSDLRAPVSIGRHRVERLRREEGVLSLAGSAPDTWEAAFVEDELIDDLCAAIEDEEVEMTPAEVADHAERFLSAYIQEAPRGPGRT